MKKTLTVLAFAVAFTGSALAADPKFDAFMGRVVGNQTTVTFGGDGTPLVTSSAHLGNAPVVGNMRVTGDASGVRLEGRATTPVAGTAKTVPVDVKAPISKGTFGKALMLAGKIAWPIGVVIHSGDIYDLLTGIGLTNIRNTANGVVADISSPNAPQSNGYQYKAVFDTVASDWQGSHWEACTVVIGLANAKYTNTKRYYTSSNETTCKFSIYSINSNTGAETLVTNNGAASIQKRVSACPAGLFVTSGGCFQNAPLQTLNDQEIADRIAQESGWPSSSARALAWAMNVPGVGKVVESETPNIVGPFAVPGEKTTTTQQVKLKPGTTTIADPSDPVTQQGTKTTTSQQTTKLNYDQNKITTSTSVSNTTNITNNVTNQTINEGDTTTETEEAPEIEVCGLPGTPACKIDETGTPEAKQDTAEADAKKAIKPLDDFIANPTSALPTFPTINWAFTLPSGCAPIALPAFEPWLQQIDVCAFQPMFHDIMTFVWVLGGIFGAIGTFWRNTFSQG